MKDEEMAEELVKRNVCGHCNRCQSHGYIGCDIYRYSKDSFLAGLNAGRPQWHDLRKDPNDLPKECKNVLCFVWQGEGYYCVGHIIKGGDNSARWWASNKSEQLNVIAWCEIPQFKE